MPILETAGVRIHRTGTGAPLVLLHGLGADHAMWNVLSGVTSRFDTLSYDLPGHGDTAAPETPIEIQDLSDQLAIILDQAGIERAHVMGSSAGGMIALQFAAAFPHRIARLVLCDTSPALGEGTRDALRTVHDRGPIHAAMAVADLMDVAEEVYAPTLILCAEGAPLDIRDGADFLARSILGAHLAFAPDAACDSVRERPEWVMRVLSDFLG